MARPEIPGALGKVPPRVGFSEQKLHVRAVCLACVARQTRRDYVPRRVVTAAYAGLHMIYTQGLRCSFGSAVHTVPLVAREHGVAGD